MNYIMMAMLAFAVFVIVLNIATAVSTSFRRWLYSQD